jgi:DNA modification methylase
MNRLYYGDNLTIMQRMPKNCVDLIYLDPPFNSKQNYNLLYKNLICMLLVTGPRSKSSYYINYDQS